MLASPYGMARGYGLSMCCGAIPDAGQSIWNGKREMASSCVVEASRMLASVWEMEPTLMLASS